MNTMEKARIGKDYDDGEQVDEDEGGRQRKNEKNALILVSLEPSTLV